MSTSYQSKNAISWTLLNKLFPASFMSEIVPDVGSDGVMFGKGSKFAETLKSGEFNYDCSHCHQNSCWNFPLEKMDTCTPKFAKTYFVIHLIPLLLFKRKELRNKPWPTIKQFLIGFLKSMAFIEWYCYFGTRAICAVKGFKNKQIARKPQENTKQNFLTS